MAPNVGSKDDGGHYTSHQHATAWAERALKHSHCPNSLLSTPKRKCKRTSYNNKTKPPSTTFSFPHLSAIQKACQVQYLGGNQRKKLGWWYIAANPRASHPVGRKQRKLLCWWWSYQEPIPLPVTNTFSFCCHLQSLSSCCQAQYLGENKGKHCVGGGPTKNLSAASDKHTFTLLPSPIAGKKPKLENCKPPYKYNHLKH